MRQILILLFISVFISSCADDPNRKQNMGTIIGGATGALLGSTLGGGDGKILAIAAGAIGGAFIGNQIGKSMDETDKLKLEQNAQKSLEYAPSGKTSTWSNPDTGNHGTFTPKKAYETDHGYCREFTQHITVAGKTQDAYGTACRQPDGSWKIIN
ncbi:MAG: RT0821/Lpp0805 family surface protein [Pseudomonadota bacterium]